MKKLYFLIAFFTFLHGYAQWTSDTAVNTLAAASNSDDTMAAGTSDGGTYIVFWKTVPDPVNYELRVQLLDREGNLQFGPDGMLISDAIPMSTYTYIWKITTDADDNLYVSVTGSNGNGACIFKITTNGGMPWGENGINPGTGFIPTVLPLSGGDVIIAYWPGSQKAKMQRYTLTGAAVWEEPMNITSESFSSATAPGDMYELSNGDFVVVFHTKLSFGIGSNLYAQRYSPEGLAQWASPLKLSNRQTVYTATYSTAQDGDVIYYGYSASTGSRFDAFLQRIDPDGTLPWGVNGMDFDTNETNYEMATSIALDPASSYVWAITRYTTSAQSDYGEFVQKFDKLTGAKQFTANAKEIFPINANSKNHDGNLYLVNDQPVFLFKAGFDNGVSPITLSAAMLDTDGNPAWDEPLPVATFAAAKSRISFAGVRENQGVAVFIDKKADNDSKIYAQNFTIPALGKHVFEHAADGIAVYPNPSAGVVSIRSSTTINAITAYNTLGQEVYSSKPLSGMEATVDAASWTEGPYFIVVETPRGRQTVKLLKLNK